MDAAGVALIDISIGTPESGANFCERSGFPADNLFCNPDRSLYMGLNFKKGWMSTLFRWGSLQNYDKSMTMQSKFDLALQQGGVLVVDSRKTLAYFHSEQGPGDVAPIQDVISACCSH
ncbi:hypothetical protein WJX74_001899 [Apatococcus lobatus]|uniref:Uncharacterized protein n=1 Tax=Apatococcus lobatus TaxID=904363 RepID=A0AAW1RGV8_9CHLO